MVRKIVKTKLRSGSHFSGVLNLENILVRRESFLFCGKEGFTAVLPSDGAL